MDGQVMAADMLRLRRLGPYGLHLPSLIPTTVTAPVPLWLLLNIHVGQPAP